jgi:hypothetical protein
VSVWTKDGTRKVNMPELAEREGIRLLRGVGGDREWWAFAVGPHADLVGYLRVSLTGEEYALVPPGIVTSDAGEAGPERLRSLR